MVHNYITCSKIFAVLSPRPLSAGGIKIPHTFDIKFGHMTCFGQEIRSEKKMLELLCDSAVTLLLSDKEDHLNSQTEAVLLALV